MATIADALFLLTRLGERDPAAPMGTLAESIEEKPQRRSQIRMAIRLVQYASADIQQTEAPLLRLDKHFLLREGALKVEVGLDRQWYTQGSPINVCLRIHNRSSRIVKKIQVLRSFPYSLLQFFRSLYSFP